MAEAQPKAVRCLVPQLVETLHIPKITWREAPGVRNLFLKIPAQRSEETRAPPTLGMKIGNVFSQSPVEHQHLSVYRNRRLDLTATILLAWPLHPGQVLRVVLDGRFCHGSTLPRDFPELSVARAPDNKCISAPHILSGYPQARPYGTR